LAERSRFRRFPQRSGGHDFSIFDRSRLDPKQRMRCWSSQRFNLISPFRITPQQFGSEVFPFMSQLAARHGDLCCVLSGTDFRAIELMAAPHGLRMNHSQVGRQRCSRRGRFPESRQLRMAHVAPRFALQNRLSQ
jgi:hypothetical protein